MIKRHPGRGAELLEGVVGPDIVSMIRHHHERLGGSGYPDALHGGRIRVEPVPAGRGSRFIFTFANPRPPASISG